MNPVLRDSEISRRLDAVAAGLPLHVEQVIHDSGKSVLATGEFDRKPAVIKLLTSGDEFWQAKWRHEVAVYRAFTTLAPPVRVPRMAYTDGEMVLVLERLDGRPVSNQRYPPNPLPDDAATSVLDAVVRLGGWSPPAGSFPRIFDYAERISRYHAKGFLSDADRDSLLRLLGRCGSQWVFAHGDPLPGNLLLMSSGDCALVDWEFAGLYLPGHDLAMLYMLLGAHTPRIRQRIDDLAAADGIEASFLVNLANVLTRELRIHLELADRELRAARLPYIRACWEQARERIHAAGGR